MVEPQFVRDETSIIINFIPQRESIRESSNGSISDSANANQVNYVPQKNDPQRHPYVGALSLKKYLLFVLQGEIRLIHQVQAELFPS